MFAVQLEHIDPTEVQELVSLASHTCILASNPVCPAASMFSDPAMSTSINLPPTDGTSRII